MDSMFSHADAVSKGRSRVLAWELFVMTRLMLLDSREERIKLEARVAQLEARPVPAHRGPWRANSCYSSEGTLVQHLGCCWWSTESANNDEPSTADTWILVAQRGRDARRSAPKDESK
jgi:hypothetical protein